MCKIIISLHNNGKLCVQVNKFYNLKILVNILILISIFIYNWLIIHL
jgi:hypothetical protein